MPILLQSQGILEQVIKNVTSSSINSAADGAALAVLGGVTGLAAILMFVQCTIEIGKKFLGDGSPNFSFLVKYGLMALALASYVPIMKTVDLAMSIPLTAVKSFTAGVTNKGQKIVQFDEAKRKLEREAKYNDMNILEETYAKTTDGLSDVSEKLNPRFWCAEILSFLYDLVKFVVILVRQYLLSVLYILGPISLALSFIAKLEGSFVGFLKYYIVIHLWATVTYGIDGITAVLKFNEIIAEQSTATADGIPSWEILVIQAGLIIINCMTPKIADILVSGTQGGAFFSAVNAYAAKQIATLKSGAGAALGGRGVINGDSKITKEGGGLMGVAGRYMGEKGFKRTKVGDTIGGKE